MNRESLFKINLLVDVEAFNRQLVFGRGTRSCNIHRKTGLFKEEPLDIAVYERVALITARLTAAGRECRC